MLARIFLTPDETRPGRRRLRAGWRILAQMVLMTAIGVAATLLVGLLIPLDASYNMPVLLASQLATFVSINASVFLARRFFDRRSLVSLGLQLDRRSALELLAGFLIAAAMMLLIYFIERAAGWLTFQGFAWQRISASQAALATLVMLAVFIIVGWQEELLARGYQLQNIAEGTNLLWGVLLSSLLFALAHGFNPNMSFLSAAGLFLAGLFLAYAYVRTRRLWLPIGLHIGWNFFEGVVLGFPVSGLSMFRLVEQSVNGPEVFTGGAFGPEAGLVLLPALALGTFLVYYYTGVKPIN